MPSRRPHRKSRHGCTTCRSRKIRCDMIRPICKNCSKRPERASTCSFTTDGIGPAHTRPPPQILQPSLQDSPSDAVAKPNERQTTSLSPISLLASPQIFSDHQLELLLLHHYTHSTSLTLSDSSAIREAWQVHAPAHGLCRFSPLLDSIFAISALHLAHLEASGSAAYTPYMSHVPCFRTERLVEASRAYNSRALKKFIPFMSEEKELSRVENRRGISQDTCHGTFAFSTLLGAICFALLRWDYGDGKLDDTERPPKIHVERKSVIDGVAEVFSLMQGAVTVAMRAKQWLRKGDFKPMMGLGEWPGIPNSASHSSTIHLQILESLAQLRLAVRSGISQISCVDDEACLATVPALAALFSLPTCSTSSPNETREGVLGSLLAWPILNAQKLIQLYRDGDELSLILLAFYGAAVHMHRQIWFLEHVGKIIVETIDTILREEVRSWIACIVEAVTD